MNNPILSLARHHMRIDEGTFCKNFRFQLKTFQDLACLDDSPFLAWNCDTKLFLAEDRPQKFPNCHLCLTFPLQAIASVTCLFSFTFSFGFPLFAVNCAWPHMSLRVIISKGLKLNYREEVQHKHGRQIKSQWIRNIWGPTFEGHESVFRSWLSFNQIWLTKIDTKVYRRARRLIK